jgi:hypothetical protein
MSNFFFYAYQSSNGKVDLIRWNDTFNPLHTEEWAEARLDIARKSKRRYSAMDIDSDRSYTGRYIVAYVDEESGIITADPFHFEDWLDKLGNPF